MTTWRAGPRLLLRPEFCLTDGRKLVRLREREGLICLALMFHGELGKTALADLLWPDPDSMPETWARVLDQEIHRLRVALKLFGWTATARHSVDGHRVFGFGWHLERF